MIEMGAAIQISEVNSLREAIESLALDEAARQEMTQRQSKWAVASRGALARTFEAIEGFVRDGGLK
jgi:3-deoxy-D-manno-octulosonic-acid transferase